MVFVGLVALTLVTGLLVAGPARAGDPPEGWRTMQLSPERSTRLTDELTRALKARWPKRLLEFTVGLERPRIETDGARFCLVADRARVDVLRGSIGDLPVASVIEVESVGLDYSRLGVGRIEFLRDARLRMHVRIGFPDIDRLLAKAGFVDSSIEFDEATGAFTIRTYRPIQFLVFRWKPRIVLRGVLFSEDTFVGVRGLDVDITGLPRFVERIAQKKLDERIGRRIDLRDEYAKLARQGVRILGGSVELHRDGKVLVKKDVPGDPALPGTHAPPPPSGE